MPPEAGRTAARAGVGRLVLTHIPPWTDREAVRDEAAREYDGEILLADATRLHDLVLTSWRYLHPPERLVPRTLRKLAVARGLMVYEGLR